MIPLKDSQPARIFPFWVLTIIAINIYVFYLELTSVNPDFFISQYALIPKLVDLSIPQTLMPFITSQFLHAGFIHIISNMLFLWIFGDNVEERLGFLLFPLFYLTGGAIGGLAQYFLIPDSAIPMLGASGAVAAVLGAYFVLFPNHTVKTLVPVFGFFTIIDIPASVMLFYWFFTQLFSGVATIPLTLSEIGGIAFFAHIGGFVFGWIVGSLFKNHE
ncbi:rhomboid family intramembrane serine protease [Candidatus Microgenomates bacterium]|nr:rhomboid family intramembrane serine protease [Candidatus Microgenomates bacterium]